MRILLVGAGVIGTVYGAHLAKAGAQVSVLAHGSRTAEIASSGLVARNLIDRTRIESAVAVVGDADVEPFDLILVSVRTEQLADTLTQLPRRSNDAAVLILGNTTNGRPTSTGWRPSGIFLGFPGVAGQLVGGVVDYVLVNQQPTALERSSDPRMLGLESLLRQSGFSVHPEDNMDGWLVYHAVFIVSITAALSRCGTDPVRLSQDRETLGLMCRAISGGFAGLRRRGVRGAPTNLSLLHSRWLRLVAVRYWARTMRSPQGEIYFAAHARRARVEMETLAGEVMAKLNGDPGVEDLRRLLELADVHLHSSA